MDRLTKRTEYGVESAKRSVDSQAGEILNRLADFEDADEQGFLIMLPCKVGDCIYINYKKGITPAKILRFLIYNTTSITIMAHIERQKKVTYFGIKEIGENIFLSRAAAEAKR
jgi:hypothetical protein